MTEWNRRQRDNGLTLVKQATTWLAAGGVAATGLFAGLAVVSNAGHSKAAKTAATTGSSATSGATTTTTPSSSEKSDDGPQFKAPATAPTTVNSGGAVVSGGS